MIDINLINMDDNDDPNLIGYYPMDSTNVINFTNQNIIGTNNGASLADRFGDNSALYFNGTSNVVINDYDEYNFSTNFTICLWLKVDSFLQTFIGLGFSKKDIYCNVMKIVKN